MFNKRHYEAIAAALRRTRVRFNVAVVDHAKRKGSEETLEILEAELDTLFRADNPNYKPDRFAKATRVP